MPVGFELHKNIYFERGGWEQQVSLTDQLL